MQLSWNRDEDGVITVYGTTTDGRIYDVADFWVTPMIERLGVSRELALDWQRQHAELLVNTFNNNYELNS